MIQYIDNFNLLPKLDCQLLFNPVSAKGKTVYNETVKDRYPKAYVKYKSYIQENNNAGNIVGELQLVKIKDFAVLHGFVYEDGKLQINELVDILLEIYNMADKYKLNIALPLDMGLGYKSDIEQMGKIINTIFEDSEFTVFVYKRYNIIHLRH